VEMWAQDAAAMYGYAAASALATTLTPFTSPSQNTNPGGLAAQAAAAAQAAGISVGNVQSTLSNAPQAMAAVPSALNGLATPAQAVSPLDLVNLLGSLSGIFVDPEVSAGGLAVDSTALPYDVVGAYTGFHTDGIVSGWAGIQTWPGYAPVPPTPFPVITNLASGSAVSAGLAEAKTIGGLSVPPAWTAETTMIRPMAVALPATSVGAAAELSAGSGGSLFSQLALAGMAGRAMAGTGGAGGAPGRRERIGAPATMGKTNHKEAPPEIPAGGPVSIAAELRELASLRDAGILTDEEFTEQKKRLLAH
jgi:PPE-repeat protein